MKNVFKLIGVIALVAVIVFGVAACGDGGGGGVKDNGNDGIGTNIQNVDVYNLNGTPFTRSGKVWLEYFNKNNSYVGVKEIGNITNGKLSFTLPDLSADIAKGDLAADAFDLGGTPWWRDKCQFA